ncbi:MAG TPA: 4-(cytidine 5'-diphospho)-2-C-methyl-D-erythritol kinase [Vicinamibacterales bacterium]|nr:4-(cytidine 5'-diphospho)-2-C-methyl-D-erythritol kinase [Vicinamibacterales bacterium]
MSPSSPRVIEVRAFAKINLTLRVLGMHADGYHELRTVFQSLDLHDSLTFAAVRGPFAITCDDPACPADESNLVFRAAARLWEMTGRGGGPRGVSVRIAKRIPMQAGLGGGSSDAAATLRALRELWQLEMPDARLHAIARALGADVPYFLEGGTVLGLERGDLLYPLIDARPAWVVLVRPDFGVSTKDAFGWWDADLQSRRAPAGSAGTSEQWVNDLQPAVAARHPRIATIARQLRRAGARYAAMSGSGSAVFGLFAEEAEARRAAETSAGRRVATWVTRTTSRREYLRGYAPRQRR